MTLTSGQTDACSFDPDVIFFENIELENLRKSVQNGDCDGLSVGWKMEMNDALQRFLLNNRTEVATLSESDLHKWNALTERRPEEGPDIVFIPGERAHKKVPGRRPERHLESNIFDGKFHNKHISKLFTPTHHGGINQIDFYPKDYRNRENKNDSNNSKPAIQIQIEEHPLFHLFNAESRQNRTSATYPVKSRPDKLVPGTASFETNPSARPLIRPKDVDGMAGPTTSTPAQKTDITTLPGPLWATPASVCVQSCPITHEYNPVCGSDRVTYVNPGRLRCEQLCGKGNYSLSMYST